MEPQPEWSMVRGIFWGYTRIKVNKNVMTVEVASDQGGSFKW